MDYDISGSAGNAYAILGWVEKNGLDYLDFPDDLYDIIDEMQSKDYNHLLAVFNLYFGDYVELVSPYAIPNVDNKLYKLRRC